MWEKYGYFSMCDNLTWIALKCYHIPEKSAPSFVSTDFMPLHITNAVANKKAVWLLPKFVDISKYLRKKTEKIKK